MEELKIKISVDTSEIDEAIEKLDKLNDELKDMDVHLREIKNWYTGIFATD